MRDKLKELWELFFAFAKIGLFTFGGGYAMLPMIQREVVENHGWATDDEILDYYAIGQCTPGVIAVNTATFVGNSRAGAAGGIAATLGVIFPSVVIITIIASFLRTFAGLPVVRNAFAGIRICVCALILNAVIKLMKKGVKGALGITVFAAVLAVMVVFDPSPIFAVVGAALCGLLWPRRQKEGGEGK